MSTQTLDKPDTDTTTDDDREKFFHYVKKNAIPMSVLTGGHVMALCGKTFLVTKSAKKDSPVCPDCKRLYDMLAK